MNEFKSMGDAVQEMFEKNKSLQRNQEKVEVKEIVEKILGNHLLQYIQEIKIKEKNILIRTHESILKHEIKLSEKSFIELINQTAKKNVVEKITLI